jgi:hypothetical protein
MTTYVLYGHGAKLSDPDIAFPESLHEKKPKLTSKKVQSRILPNHDYFGQYQKKEGGNGKLG